MRKTTEKRERGRRTTKEGKKNKGRTITKRKWKRRRTKNIRGRQGFKWSGVGCVAGWISKCLKCRKRASFNRD